MTTQKKVKVSNPLQKNKTDEKTMRAWLGLPTLSQEGKLTLLTGLFVASLIAANLLGNKITTLFGISFSVGIFAFPLTFLITDIVAEVYGKKKAQELVYAGLISLLFVFLLTALALVLPPASRFEHNDAYTTIFGVSLRILFASIVAFLISQYHDIWSFHFWKEKTKGRFLWLRNNLSTIVSQFIDTTIFMFLAFYMVSPKFTAGFIFTLIIPYWLLKVLVALFDTPFCYLGVAWLKGKKQDVAGATTTIGKKKSE
ncbi:MAG: queuosine precursor transporter [Candidatus Woesearchaeota archaeon]